MNSEQLSCTTKAWIEAWLYGNARPDVVVAALRGLADRSGNDPQAYAIIERALWTIVAHPYGSVRDAI